MRATQSLWNWVSICWALDGRPVLVMDGLDVNALEWRKV